MSNSLLTWVEISSSNLTSNLKHFRRILGNEVKIMSIVKSNAYGHGLKEVAKIISNQKTDWYGVNNLDEAIILREEGITLPILVLGYLPLEDLKEAIRQNISFVTYQKDVIDYADREAEKLRKKASIHLKIETGTNRLGVRKEEALKLAKIIRNKKNIYWEGVYTHFADIEDRGISLFAHEQLKEFKNTLSLLEKDYGAVPFKHAACTAAILGFSESHFNLVRLGIGLYLGIKPVLTWKTRLVQIKKVPKGETVGYGRTYRASKEMRLGIIPVGYWDGYDRKLSNCGQVLIQGRRAPIVGRICMNMSMIDLSDITRVKVGEEVILLGRDSYGQEISSAEIGEKINTINYEVLTRINPLLPRIIY